ncbi:MAG: TonB family protein [Prevotellaceae bacterium]|jgi:TonB family protein|nr:TonB family protein [Prevotellaceae bacterium]
MDTQEHFIDKEKLDALFVEHRSVKQWIKDNLSGIYATIIFHLLIFSSLALNEIRTHASKSVLVEFLVQDIEKEPEINPVEEKKIIEEELNKMLKNMPDPNIKLPNLAVNAAVQGSESGRGQSASASFFSSKNTSSIREEKEKKEREKEQEEKKNRGTDEVKSDESAQAAGEESQAYKGPSIVSYYLEGRTEISMPIPSYKCYNGGDVTVLIEVNSQGYVIAAEIDVKNSSADECLHRAAKEAAERARFSTSQNQGTQKGNIIYRFVSQ